MSPRRIDGWEDPRGRKPWGSKNWIGDDQKPQPSRPDPGRPEGGGCLIALFSLALRAW